MTGLDTLALAKRAQEALLEKKAENVLLVDVRGVSGVTDFYLVASGSSRPQLKAMFNEVLHALRREGVQCYRQSADTESGWLVLDYVDLVIHMLSPEARAYYAVEELWARSLPPA